MTDAEIIDCYQARDYETPCRYILKQAAWTKPIERYVASNSGQPDEVRELPMEAVLVLSKTIEKGKYEGKGPLKNYYIGIGILLWKKRLELKQLYRDRMEQLPPAASAYVAELLCGEPWREDYELVMKGMEKLSEKNRQILIMRSRDYPYAEIAELLDLASADGARTKFARARDQLLRAIGRVLTILF